MSFSCPVTLLICIPYHVKLITYNIQNPYLFTAHSEKEFIFNKSIITVCKWTYNAKTWATSSPPKHKSCDNYRIPPACIRGHFNVGFYHNMQKNFVQKLPGNSLCHMVWKLVTYQYSHGFKNTCSDIWKYSTFVNVAQYNGGCYISGQ